MRMENSSSFAMIQQERGTASCGGRVGVADMVGRNQYAAGQGNVFAAFKAYSAQDGIRKVHQHPDDRTYEPERHVRYSEFSIYQRFAVEAIYGRSTLSCGIIAHAPAAHMGRKSQFAP